MTPSEFEQALSDLVTENLSREELSACIKHFRGTDLGDLLEEEAKWYD